MEVTASVLLSPQHPLMLIRMQSTRLRRDQSQTAGSVRTLAAQHVGIEVACGRVVDEAVREAVDYAVHNQELLQAERAREEERSKRLGLDKPPFVPVHSSTSA